MKEKSLFKVGITLFMEQQKGSQLVRYRSKVYDVTDNHIHISPLVNMENGREAVTIEGEMLTCFFVATDQLYYKFDAVIVKRTLEPIRSLIFEIPEREKLTKIQRREYVRVESRFDAAVDVNNQPFSLEHMVTVDISGGGCSFVLPKGKQYFPGTIFNCCLALPFQKGMDYMEAKARLIRTDFVTQPKRLCCEFVDMSEKQRNHLIQFVFEQQVELRNQTQSLLDM